MKTIRTEIAVAQPDHMVQLVNEFASNFSTLLTQSGAIGKCKLVSYELTKYLRKRGLKAALVHVQGVKAGVYPNPHRNYVDKPRKDWSHYVVKVGHVTVDLSVRQFDTTLPYPYFSTLHEMRQQWDVVETDKFINRWVREALRHTDAA
jgi:hypothetical protein